METPTPFPVPVPVPVPVPPVRSTSPRRLLALLAATGLLGIGYEVLVVRVLSQVAEDTVYTFAMLLAVYLVGSALGSAAYPRWFAAMRFRPLSEPLAKPISGPLTGPLSGPFSASISAPIPNPRSNSSTGRFVGAAGFDTDRLCERLLHLLAAACLLGTASLWGAESVKAAVLRTLGPGLPAALAAEAALAVVAFLLPTFVMGALFTHLSTQARASGIGFGRSLGINTLGAAVAPLLFGVWLAPGLGFKYALVLIAVGYLALSLHRARLARGVWVTAGAALALTVWTPPLAFIDIPDGGQVLSYREGPTAAVSVVEDAEGVRRLRIDNRQQEGSSSSLLADSRQALLPLLLHPAPRHALFLGLGTGTTAAAAAEDPKLQVDAVELLPEVIEASTYFAAEPMEGASDAANSAPDSASRGNPPPLSNPRLHLIAADARRFVRAGGPPYDVIVSDNFHPARSGSGALYTVEHFRAVQGRLAAGGLFCQWLPLHQLDLPTLRSIVKAFITVYPGGAALLATNSLETPVLGLVGRADAGRFDVGQVRERLSAAAFPRPLEDFGLADEFALLGSFVAGPRALTRFAGAAVANTDDHPVVAYRAPRVTYAPESLPRDRLMALLEELAADPQELIVDPPDSAWPARLAAYWSARNRFIAAGRDVQPSADVRRMLAQVREPLLAVLRISPDFRPAYDPLLRMAMALRRSDAAESHALLSALVRIQPARPEAFEALHEMGDANPP